MPAFFYLFRYCDNELKNNLINRNIQLVVMRQNEQDCVKLKVYLKCYDDVVNKILMIWNNQIIKGFDWSDQIMI